MTPFPIRVLAYLRRNNGPIAGDLMEEYGRGRSTMWLWRQVAVALATGAWSDLQRHPVAGVQAAVVLALFLPAVLLLLSVLPQPLEWRTSGPVAAIRLQLLLKVWLLGFVASMCCGWTAGRLAGRFKVPVLISLAVVGTLMIAKSAWFVAGVLWLYPWNGVLAFTPWASIYASFLSLFLVGLCLGGWLSIRRITLRRIVESPGA